MSRSTRRGRCRAFPDRGSAAGVLLMFLCSCAPADSGATARDSGAAGATARPSAAAPTAASPELPGAPPFPPELRARVEKRRRELGLNHKPRTRHLNPDGTARYTNRLILASSPYLQQHAHNPVNWFSWSDDAFETARRLARPVLLSVGYSTCHWCHVMEEESFEDLEIARFMNENYVAIKVDREERPDVDNVYMTAVRMLTGGGGWPMTVWLTPDREPFYGGTYFPAREGDRGARTGFLTLLRQLKGTYDGQPDRVASLATRIVQAIQENLSPGAAGERLPGARVVQALARSYQGSFDGTHGGMARAPKFPSSLSIRFLLRHHRRTGDGDSLRMATLTLEKMAAGGMYDQVGGGFHRYSTDRTWLVPHFEKMLYDNALLTLAYLEGYQVTGREDFARVAREILRYVRRDMTSPDGGFYSATDADSPTPGGRREEGWFYTWTPAEIDAVLEAEPARLVKAYYRVTGGGNFEGRNILHAPRPLAVVARELKVPPDHARSRLDQGRDRLYRARSKRPPPLRDEKVLTAWNGLMISALARGALVLREPEYAEQAARAADFLLTRLLRDGRLLRSYKDGQAYHNGYLDDYAFLIAGLIDLYEATGDLKWIREAISLDRVLEAHYEDRARGGFYLTSDNHEDLLAREKPGSDGAEPSGNSVQALNLLRLHEFTTEDRYRRRAEATLRSFQSVLERQPAALSEMLLAVDYRLDTPKEIVIVTPSAPEQAEPLLARLRRTFLPNRILSVVSEGSDLRLQADVIPIVADKTAIGGKATAYVCERRVCELPTSDPEVFAEQIAKVKPLGGSGGNEATSN